jgi:hypothetical protein
MMTRSLSSALLFTAALAAAPAVGAAGWPQAARMKAAVQKRAKRMDVPDSLVSPR